MGGMVIKNKKKFKAKINKKQFKKYNKHITYKYITKNYNKLGSLYIHITGKTDRPGQQVNKHRTVDKQTNNFKQLKLKNIQNHLSTKNFTLWCQLLTCY